MARRLDAVEPGAKYRPNMGTMKERKMNSAPLGGVSSVHRVTRAAETYLNMGSESQSKKTNLKV